MRRTVVCGVVGALLGWASIGTAQPAGELAPEEPGAVLATPATGADATADAPSSGNQKSLLDDRIGIDVGARFGFSVPFGNVAKVGPLQPRSDDVGAAQGIFLKKEQLRRALDGQLPVQIDLGFRITENFVVGVYGSWGKAFLASSESPFNCNDEPVRNVAATPGAMPTPGSMAASTAAKEYDCSGSILRAGVQARYHAEPNELVDPWVGIGFGFESMNITLADTKSSLNLSGFEFFNLAAGFDIRLVDALRFGPYLQASIGQYSSISDEQDIYAFEQGCPGQQCAIPDENVKLDETHYWVTGGLRLSHVFCPVVTLRYCGDQLRYGPLSQVGHRVR